MFTGLIEGTGVIKSIQRRSGTAVFEIEAAFDLQETNVGGSIAIDGCCLTVTSRLGNRFWADISDETLRVSTLGGRRIGDLVNLERALRIGDRLGGHMVQGHVDGVGKIKSLRNVESGKEIEMEIPERLVRYIVEKGSIAVDGISLTINSTKGNIVFIRVIPHTIEATTLKNKRVGDHVNLEVDIIGKYVEKLRFLGSEEYHEKGEITEDFLRKHGF